MAAAAMSRMRNRSWPTRATGTRIRPKLRKKNLGMSLIELLVALSVAVILLSIAVPSYQDSVRKSRRADAHVALGGLMQRLERCATQFGRFDHAGCVVGSPHPSPEGYYAITAVRTATTYLLTATPVGNQSSDKDCTSLSMDHLGQRLATGAAPDRCW